MCIIIDIRRGGRSAKGPGWITRDLVLGLTEEPHWCVTVCEFDASPVEEGVHFVVGDLRDGSDMTGGQDGREDEFVLEPHCMYLW